MIITGKYPNLRLRRNRKEDWTRRLVKENTLSVNDLILPIFLTEGKNKKQSIKSMPDIFRYSVDRLSEILDKAVSNKIPMVALFPYTDSKLKNNSGTESLNQDNLVCKAIQYVKKKYKNSIGIMCDVALDPYTSHGHDGLLIKGKILNDETVKILIKQSLLQAEMGCDVISPSDMMDGRIGEIRKTLDKHNFKDVQILSYAVKYASSFYGPFRNAVGSKKLLKGDKKTYQMDPANSDEALREVALDISEGADMVMVKPGLPYMDVIWRVKEAFGMPTFAYNVSGEYAMVRGAGDQGWLDYDKAVIEMLTGFKRAGADGILTYHALDAAKILGAYS